MYNPIVEFGKTLFKNNFINLGEYIENGLDSVIEDELIKNFPIFKTIIGLTESGRAIYERNRITQIITFINEFNAGAVDKDKLAKYQEKIKDEKVLNKELGRVLLILESNIDMEKSAILAKLYGAYINEEIPWDIFCEFTEITNRMYIVDFKFLKLLWLHKNNDSETESDRFRLGRIYSAGLIRDKNIIMDGTPPGLDNRILSPLGQEYCNLIFRKGTK